MERTDSETDISCSVATQVQFRDNEVTTDMFHQKSSGNETEEVDHYTIEQSSDFLTRVALRNPLNDVTVLRNQI